MHEYSLVESLVRRVEDEARRHGATRIRSLRVSVGEMAGVDPVLLRTAYEVVRQGTLCDAAGLQVVTCPASWVCPSCGSGLEKWAVLRCAGCGVPAVLTDGSDALILESVELEVP